MTNIKIAVKIASVRKVAQAGRNRIPAARKTVIAKSSAVGKITTCGQPYLVSGILIRKYDTFYVVDNQEISLCFAGDSWHNIL